MTNGEKYKTAQERAEAFAYYCDGKMAVTNKGCIVEPDCNECRFAWLDLEAEEEDEVIDDMRKVVEMMRKKESGGETLLDVSVIFDKFLNRIIAVAKKCREGKE